MTKRHKRTAKKLLLPLIAVGMMTMMMAIEAANRPHESAGYHAPAAARLSHQRQR